MKILHSARATATAATGDETPDRAEAADGLLGLDMARGPVAGDAAPSGPRADPADLLAAAWSSSFLAALRQAASAAKLKLSEGTAVHVRVGRGLRKGGGEAVEVAVQVALPGMNKDRAEDLVERAAGICALCHLAREGLELRCTVS